MQRFGRIPRHCRSCGKRFYVRAQELRKRRRDVDEGGAPSVPGRLPHHQNVSLPEICNWRGPHIRLLVEVGARYGVEV